MPHYKPPYTITSKILKLSTQISEQLAKLELTTNSMTSPMLRKKNRIKTLVGTLEIEGNYLGEEKITAILDGKRVLGTVVELAEVEGAIEAYLKLDTYQFDRLEDLQMAHGTMMNGILKTAGRFRGVNVGVGGHVAPPPAIVSELMTNLFSWLKTTDEHPLIVSSVFHYEFEFIHPFSDGNGRMGRLWQNVILQNYKKVFGNIAIESIVRDHQEGYYKAIADATNEGDSTIFIEFMLEMIYEAIVNSYESDQESNLKSDQKILIYIKENKNITIRELCEKLSMSESGIKKVIKKLKDEEKLIRHGSLKAGYWEAKD